MSEGTRNTLYAGGIITVAILIAAMAWIWIYPAASYLDHAYQREADEQAEYYAKRSDIAATNRCSAIPTPGRAQCMAEERDAARSSQRNEYDLAAQRTMAVWTRAMGLAALVAMAVGVVGVGLVFVTFRETRRGANAAASSAEYAARSAKAAVDQHRAWLKVQALSISKVTFSKAMNRDGQPEYISATISIDMENVGATPATDIVWQPSIWTLGLLSLFDQWVVLWRRASAAFSERAKEMGDHGFVMFPTDRAKLVHDTNTLVWSLEGTLHLPSAAADERFRIMGVVTVLYRITSGDEAMTIVPFIVHLGERGFETKDDLRRNKERTGKDVRVTRMQVAERAT